MKFAIIAGSHRQDSQSTRIATYIEKQIIQDDAHKTYMLDLKANPLPMWDESVWESNPNWKKVWDPISQELITCDAIILVVPEWAGMVPPGVKNLLLLCGGGPQLADKPGLIVGISSGLGGTYPIAELRVNSGKNTRFVYIPDHMIIRHCEGIFASEAPASDEDKYIRDRLTYSLKVLEKYGEAFKSIRNSGVIDTKTYPFGM